MTDPVAVVHLSATGQEEAEDDVSAFVATTRWFVL